MFDAEGKLLYWFASEMDFTRRRVSKQSYLQAQKIWRRSASRMSVALISAGVKVRTGPVRLRIKAGPYKGEPVEPSQRVLSDFLARELGNPERFKGGPAARNTIAWRRGIASFFQLHGANDRQGHIDLVSVNAWPEIMCNGSCYRDAVDVWFWPLK